MNKKTIKIKITTEYVTLGQVLKLANVISTGGEAKFYLSSHKIEVNHEADNRRGRKLYPGDEAELEDAIVLIQK